MVNMLIIDLATPSVPLYITLVNHFFKIRLIRNNLHRDLFNNRSYFKRLPGKCMAASILNKLHLEEQKKKTNKQGFTQPKHIVEDEFEQ